MEVNREDLEGENEKGSKTGESLSISTTFSSYIYWSPLVVIVHFIRYFNKEL